MKGRNEHYFDSSEDKVLFLFANQQMLKLSDFTLDSLSKMYDDRFTNLSKSMDDILDSLVIKVLLLISNNNYILTTNGKKISKEILLSYLDRSYSEYLEAYDSSEIIKRISSKLYGEYLGQINMTDKDQLEKLVSLLEVNDSAKILEFGCGLGYITELVQRKTNLYVIGLDNASSALNLAN